MFKSLYRRLAADGIRHDKKLYIPYIAMGTLFFILALTMISIVGEPALQKMAGMTQLSMILTLGVIIVMIFGVLALDGGYKFIRKQRMEEEALYLVLGMERKHLRLIEAWEMLFIAGPVILLGTILGSVFYRLSLGFFIKTLKTESKIGAVGLFPQPQGILLVIAGFVLVFALVYVLGIKRGSIRAIMDESRAGEKKPRFPKLFGVLGAICIAIGYYLSLSADNPLNAIPRFFIAVAFVIVGTYWALSFLVGVIVGLLKKNKKFYLKPKNFAAVAGLAYRVSYSGKSLANIAILSTCFLVVCASGTSLYYGAEAIGAKQWPSPAEIIVFAEDGIQDADTAYEKLDAAIARAGLKGKGRHIDSLSVPVTRSGDALTVADDVDWNRLSRYENFALFYERDRKDRDDVDLLAVGDTPVEDVVVGGRRFTVGTAGDYKNAIAQTEMPLGKNGLYLAANEAVFTELRQMFNQGAAYGAGVEYHYVFEEVEGEARFSAYEKLRNDPDKLPLRVIDREETMNEFYAFYGAIFFTGFCLGAGFLLATGFSIYYKQLSEGYADKKRFAILRDLGMTDKEAKQVIRTQISAVFILPVLFALVHGIFAYPSVEKILTILLMGVNGRATFLLCCVLSYLFYLAYYFLVYARTRKTYEELVLHEK